MVIICGRFTYKPFMKRFEDVQDFNRFWLENEVDSKLIQFIDNPPEDILCLNENVVYLLYIPNSPIDYNHDGGECLIYEGRAAYLEILMDICNSYRG